VAGWTVALGLSLATGAAATAPPPGKEDMEEERREMVEEQIEQRGIENPRVLQAMRDVKRHLFVPPASRDDAYQDYPLAIGHGQTISQPYIVALMTSLLGVGPGDRVLEVGTGSGYQAAVLSRIAREVVTVERYRTLAEKAKSRLFALGYNNVEVVVGDGFSGVPERAPYDRIIVTAAAPEAPRALVAQLKVGGRMIVPLGESRETQNLVQIDKTESDLTKTNLLPVRFVPLVHGRAGVAARQKGPRSAASEDE
jgi:protein-L-isoaspartate(D-aspartate) O-methyltransferase